MNEGVGVTIPADTWILLKRQARAEAARSGWCIICETTIGNGWVVHEKDCPLYAPKDLEERRYG